MEPNNTDKDILNNNMTVTQAVNILYQAALIGQKSGIYSFNESARIKIALDVLRSRLYLNESMLPIQVYGNMQNNYNIKNKNVGGGNDPITNANIIAMGTNMNDHDMRNRQSKYKYKYKYKYL